MTDHPTPDFDAALADLLADADVWDDPAPTIEDAVVAEIAAAAHDAPVSLAARRRVDPTRRWLRPTMAAAAVAAIVVAGIALGLRGGGGGEVFALEGTDAQPGASAEAAVSATPAGLKILLTPSGLPGAPEGYMYEAWVSDGTVRISAGTFHLRGGSGTIELWAGTDDPKFGLLSVTLEPVDGDAGSSGDARLVGDIRIDD